MSKPISRVLTGITTSGTPHLGNFVGSIRPSVQASLADDAQSFYFLADYHALIKIGDPERVQRSTLEIAASWLAASTWPVSWRRAIDAVIAAGRALHRGPRGTTRRDVIAQP